MFCAKRYRIFGVNIPNVCVKDTVSLMGRYRMFFGWFGWGSGLLCFARLLGWQAVVWGTPGGADLKPSSQILK